MELGGLTHMVNNDDLLVSGGLDEGMRKGFIRKVYGILTA